MESVNIEQLVNLILEYNIEEINYINFPINQPFGLVIYSDDVKYEFIINIKNNSDKLIILGAGNLHKSVMEKFHNRPVFSRISWPFKESTIYYNDPSRFMGKKELSGGWGLGTIDHWCIEEQPQQSGEYDNYNVGGECPYCHSRDVAEYTYGYPMPKFIYDKNGNLVERKVPKPDRRVISRGCIIRDSSPLYHCYSCNRDWGRVLGAKRSRREAELR